MLILSDPLCSGSGTLNNTLDNQHMNECCLEIASSEIEQSKILRLKS
jgi:hypothetical protein